MMKRFMTAAALAIAVAGCSSTTSVGVSDVDRQQLFIFSSEEINNEAATLYMQTMDDSKANHTLNTDKAMYNRVKKVADRLIAKAPNFREDCRNWDWEVNVIDSDELNAWCMPGGKIAVYSGLVKTLKLTDDEIAVVVGHEISHALREHSREQASSQFLTKGALSVGALFGLDATTVQLSSIASDVFLTLPFSRSHEEEADEIGLELCAMAGFDVDAAVTVWQKMAAANSGNKPVEILSTHPSDESRIENLTKLAAVLKQEYKN